MKACCDCRAAEPQKFCRVCGEYFCDECFDKHLKIIPELTEQIKRDQRG